MGKIADNRHVTWMTHDRTLTTGPVVHMDVHSKTEVTGPVAEVKVRKPRRKPTDG